MTFPQASAERSNEKVWRIRTVDSTPFGSAENRRVLRSFSGVRLTVPNGEDCYTFEGFASIPDEIHTAYYYHYKRTILGLKEEGSPWS
jgi:hypothetical protein